MCPRQLGLQERSFGIVILVLALVGMLRGASLVAAVLLAIPAPISLPKAKPAKIAIETGCMICGREIAKPTQGCSIISSRSKGEGFGCSNTQLD